MSQWMIYGIKNCSSVSKVRTQFDAAGISYDFLDFKKQPPSKAQLQQWLATVSLATLLNKQSTTWRKLSEEEKQQADSLEGAITLMHLYPSLIKRPVIEQDGRLYQVGTQQHFIRG
jgi:arsenate reductase